MNPYSVNSNDSEPKILTKNEYFFKRSSSIRSSRKDRQARVKMKSEDMKAFIILNCDYSRTPQKNLLGVNADGEYMKIMMEYSEVEIVRDAMDIGKAVKKYCEEQKGKKIKRIHFHYSGHGVESDMVQIDPSQKIDEKTFIGANPTGGCLIGCAGELYSVHDLMIELLKCKPDNLTLTLDCCRSSAIRQRGNERYVRLRYKEPIQIADQLKIAVIYGTSDLHSARDANTFTQELFKVYNEFEQIPILQIVSKVNKSWRDRFIFHQICKHDIVEVGDNWKFYMWPNPHSFKSNGNGANDPDTMVVDTQEDEGQDNIGAEMRNMKDTMNFLLQKVASLENGHDGTRNRKIPRKQE